MTAVNKVEKKAELNLMDIIKYQFITYCYFEKITMSDAAIECMAHLSVAGTIELNQFCVSMMEYKLFASPQVIRNIVNQSVEKGIVIKTGVNGKERTINPDLNIQYSGNILLDFKFVYLESS